MQCTDFLKNLEIADVGFPQTPTPLESANVGHGDTPPPKNADVLYGCSHIDYQ